MLETVSPGHYRLQGTFTMQDTATLKQLLKLLNDQKSPLQQLDLDVSALESADSVLLAALITVARRVENQQGIFRITGLSNSMRGLARVYDIDALIEPYQRHT